MSESTPLWLVAKQRLPHPRVFHVITLRRHCCPGLTSYRASWKTLEILWLFHVSKLDAQLRGQASSAQKQTVQGSDAGTEHGEALPPPCTSEPGTLRGTHRGAGAGPGSWPGGVGTGEPPRKTPGLLFRKRTPQGALRRVTKGTEGTITRTSTEHLGRARPHLEDLPSSRTSFNPPTLRSWQDDHPHE